MSPNFWTDPKNGIPYYFAVQTPEYRIATINDLNNMPVVSMVARAGAEYSRQCRHRERRDMQSVSNHANIQPLYDIYASVQDSDLGSVAKASAVSSPICSS